MLYRGGAKRRPHEAYESFHHHHHHHHHHQVRVASEGCRVVAPPCPRSTARLRRSPIGRRVESFRSWSSHLFRGRPGGRRHVRSGGRLSDTSMWSRRATFGGVTSSSRAMCPNTNRLNPGNNRGTRMVEQDKGNKDGLLHGLIRRALGLSLIHISEPTRPY